LLTVFSSLTQSSLEERADGSRVGATTIVHATVSATSVSISITSSSVRRSSPARMTRGDNTFNTSEFLGTLFTSSLQNSYYPKQDRNFGETMNRFTGALSSDAIGNLQREFMPDIKRLFRKHAPKEIRKIEEKLPIPAGDKP
jgi:hypothetical protein